MRAEIVSRAERLVDIALAIADMHKSPWIAEQRLRLAHIFQPADALLLLDGNPCRIDLLLERGGSLELRPRPELERRKAQRQAIQRDGQARMFQESAYRAHRTATILVLTAVEGMHDADLIGSLSLIGELCCVLQDQDEPGAAMNRSRVD